MLDFHFLIFIFGLFVISLLALYTFKRLAKGWSLKALFKDFNRKIWMTLCLGIVFFGFYLIIVTLSAHFIRESGTEFFFLIYKNPIQFIYGGLSLFAFMSLAIYFARMLIKYFYLTRGKDS